MRVKKDNGSYNASGVLVRDARHDKSFDGSTGPVRKKKDTKKWCKGREGRQHTLEWQESKWYASRRSRLERLPIVMEIVCSVCHKSLFTDRNCWSVKWIANPPKKKVELLEEFVAKLYK